MGSKGEGDGEKLQVGKKKTAEKSGNARSQQTASGLVGGLKKKKKWLTKKKKKNSN